MLAAKVYSADIDVDTGRGQLVVPVPKSDVAYAVLVTVSVQWSGADGGVTTTLELTNNGAAVGAPVSRFSDFNETDPVNNADNLTWAFVVPRVCPGSMHTFMVAVTGSSVVETGFMQATLFPVAVAVRCGYLPALGGGVVAVATAEVGAGDELSSAIPPAEVLVDVPPTSRSWVLLFFAGVTGTLQGVSGPYYSNPDLRITAFRAADSEPVAVVFSSTMAVQDSAKPFALATSAVATVTRPGKYRCAAVPTVSEFSLVEPGTRSQLIVVALPASVPACSAPCKGLFPSPAVMAFSAQLQQNLAKNTYTGVCSVDLRPWPSTRWALQATVSATWYFYYIDAPYASAVVSVTNVLQPGTPSVAETSREQGNLAFALDTLTGTSVQVLLPSPVVVGASLYEVSCTITDLFNLFTGPAQGTIDVTLTRLGA